MTGHINERALSAYLGNTLSATERSAVTEQLAVDAEARELFVMAFDALSTSKAAMAHAGIPVQEDRFPRERLDAPAGTKKHVGTK